MNRIKCGNLDPAGTFDTATIIANAKALGLNTVNVPVQINYASATDINMTIDTAMFATAKKVVKALHGAGFQVIVEGFTWIAGGTVAETSYNPSSVSGWFTNYTAVCETILKELCIPENVWCFNVVSNLTPLEYSTSTPNYPNQTSWQALFNDIRSLYKGYVIYRTNYWYDNTNRDLKKNNPLWTLCDWVAIDAWFEITASTNNTPTLTDVLNGLVSSAVRSQAIIQEITDMQTATGLPIYFGGFGCPSTELGTYHPWDSAPSPNQSQPTQAYLFEAYRQKLEHLSWFAGFSVWAINVTDNYEVIGKQAEANVLQFLGDFAPQDFNTTLYPLVTQNSSAPSNPKTGDEWIDANKKQRYWSGSAWIDPGIQFVSVTLQPTEATAVDTMITDKYATTAYTTNAHLWVGAVSDTGTANYRTLMNWNLSAIPAGAAIISATLSLYQYGTAGASNNIDALAITSSWAESVTWNTQPTTSATVYDTAVSPGSAGWVSWDIGSLVAAWQAGTLTNNGVMLKSESEGVLGADQYFYSSNYMTDTTLIPKLVITYQPATAPAYATQASPALTGTVTVNGGALAKQVTVTYAATMTLDCSTADTFDITLTGNPTINFSNARDGQRIEVRLKQDATGGRTVTWGTMCSFGSSFTSITLTTTANKTDYIGLVYSATAAKYHVVSYNLGF